MLVVVAVVVVVVPLLPQLFGSLSRGGRLAPDLHPRQGVLSGGHEEWRMQELGEEE